MYNIEDNQIKTSLADVFILPYAHEQICNMEIDSIIAHS